MVILRFPAEQCDPVATGILPDNANPALAASSVHLIISFRNTVFAILFQ